MSAMPSDRTRRNRVAIVGTAALVTVALGTALLANAQGFRRGFRIQQNDPPATELVVARWRFGTNGLIGHMGWSHNYPSSDENLNQFIKDSTGIDVEIASFRIVELGSPEVFDYPFAYVSEPGEMELTDQEVINLREFVERGGFVLMDDFDGTVQIETMRAQVARAFPERPFVQILDDHRVLHTHFDLADLNRMSPYVPGGRIVYYGIMNDHGELAIAAGHNNDLANFWDWYDEPQMPLEPAADAFRLGVNFAIWAFTH